MTLAIIDHETHTLHIDRSVDQEILDLQYEGEEENYIKKKYGFQNYSWDYVVKIKEHNH